MLFFALLFMLSVYSAKAQAGTANIRNIYIEKIEPLDTINYGKSGFKGLLGLTNRIGNAIHLITRDYVITNELLFSRGDEIDDDLLDETERNLRRLGIFSDVKLELDTLDNVYITARDAWTLGFAPYINIGGYEKSIGLQVNELNLLGTNTQVGAGLVYVSEHQTEWEKSFFLQNDRILKFGLGGAIALSQNRYNSHYNYGLFKNFNNLADKYAGGVYYSDNYGKRFIYKHYTDFENLKYLREFKQKDVYAYFARSWYNVDRVFFSAAVELNEAEREEHKIAYDNMGKLLVEFSSSSEDWVKIKSINGAYVEDIAIGGNGGVTLARIFPIKNAPMHAMFYVGGYAARSFLSDDDKFYLYGKVQTGTSFYEGEPRFTYQDFLGLTFYRLRHDMIIGGRVYQQTTWNYGYFHRQLMLDNSNGLRGYRLNQLFGDNRLLANFEFRWATGLNLIFYQLGVNAFWDIGSVWRRGVALSKTRWHNSLGLGLRLYGAEGNSNSTAYSIDFAYNFDEKRVGEVLISTQHFFDFYGSHGFQKPRVFGIDGDY